MSIDKVDRRCSLFVGDLSMFCTESILQEVFSHYGDISEVKIIRSEETKRNLFYGFIKFKVSDSAKLAREDMNGRLICGRAVK